MAVGAGVGPPVAPVAAGVGFPSASVGAACGVPVVPAVGAAVVAGSETVVAAAAGLGLLVACCAVGCEARPTVAVGVEAAGDPPHAPSSTLSSRIGASILANDIEQASPLVVWKTESRPTSAILAGRDDVHTPHECLGYPSGVRGLREGERLLYSIAYQLGDSQGRRGGGRRRVTHVESVALLVDYEVVDHASV